MQICPACQEENPPRFRLCGFCGTALVAPVAPQEIRKTVTIVFSDLKGSTDLGERLDSESLREVMTRYFDAMRAELEAHGGVIEKFIGDAIMAVFGLPTLHEDDALRAVRAARGMQLRLVRLNEEFDQVWGVRLAQRIGVNTGEVVTGDSTTGGQRLVTGDAVNTAARLEQAAPVDEILMGELTYRLVRSAVDVEEVEPLDLKGKAAKVAAWRLLRVQDAATRHSDVTTPMVGRATEMASLNAVFRAAVDGPGLRMVTVVGDAGVGKSRLTQEFLASVAQDAYVVRGRCLPYGNGITFWPWVEIVLQAAGIADDDTPERAIAMIRGLVGDDEVTARLAAVAGLSVEPFPLSELFWAVQAFLDTLAERGPVIAVIDDIHRAEATLLELIEHLALAAHPVPVLIVCTARHELLEAHPEWGRAANAERIVLGPLGDAHAGEIVATLLGRSGLAPAILERVIQAAEGNPLFVEQLVSMLVDDGTIRRVGDRWLLADPVTEVRIPPTIHALLAARLDQLGRDERAVVEPASVVGLVFDESAVRWLLPDPYQAGLSGHLAALDQKQLVHPTGQADDGDRFRFHHILIRDAAYGGLLKRARAELHERFVQWADARNADADRALEFQEILGYHLEQAHRYLRELGPLDAHGIELGVWASERLGPAGRRAFARGDMPASANLLRRAGVVRPEGDPLRPALLIEAGESLTQAGELAAADAVLEQARREAAATVDRALEATAQLGLIYLHFLTQGTGDEGAVVAQVETAMTVLTAAGDHAGLSRAWRIQTNIHFAGCRYLAAADAAEHMIEHARLAQDRAMELRALPALATCAQLGPAPVPEAIATVRRVLAELGSDRKSEAYTQRALANLEAMRGDFDVARTLYRQSRATLEELGWRFDAALTSAIASGPVELIAGDVIAAEAELRRDFEALDAIGEQNYISTTAAFLAEALYRQGRDDEAYHMTEESERIAADDDVATQYLWRSVRAKLLARRGRPSEAEALSRTAIGIIESAQDPDSQGYAWIDLAEVLAMDGRPEEATSAADVALARFQSKGNEPSAARARQLRADILAGHGPTRPG